MKESFSNYSDKEAFRVARLIAGYIRGTLSKSEHRELDDWVAASDENMQLFERLTDEKNIEEAIQWMESIETEKALQEKKSKLVFKRPREAIRFWRYAVAASIIITAGILMYVFRDSNNEKKNNVVVTNSEDLLPGSDKATLALSNGKIIVLGETDRDTTINEQIKILSQKGEIVYSNKDSEKELEYHTLTIPRKGHYRLVLPDGTQVWLNSESSIRYPTAFTGKERKVFITGETFFEVAKNKDKPFIVVTGDVQVEALGTQFNINAYSNEPFLTATLIDGAILVSNSKNENMLKPGQQAQIAHNDFSVVETDTMDVVAWKNDQFKFTNATIDVIMRQVERWYDAEVVYENKPTAHFYADIPRNVPVSKLLRFLELTDKVHFKIEGSKIIVLE